MKKLFKKALSFFGYELRNIARKDLEETSAKKATSNFNWDNCDIQTNGELFFLNSLSKHWKVCLDIGANKGNYASAIHAKNPSCRLICFEPNPQLIDEIKSNGINEVYNCAVGKENGSIPLFINTANSTQSSTYRQGQDMNKIDVDIITLDNFANNNGIDHIDFVKIDTEGAELDVLKGARNLLLNRRIDIIQFEYGGTYLDSKISLKDVYDLLSNDYLICHLYPTGILPYSTYHKDMETYRYSNWIAISRDIGKKIDIARDNI